MLIKLLRDIFKSPARPTSRIASADAAEIDRCIADGDLERAQLLCDAALKDHSADPSALHFAGVVAYRRGNSANAVSLLTRAVQGATDPGPAVSLARILQGLGRDAEALDYYLQALDADPQLFEAHLAAGGISFRKRDFAAAERHFREAIRLRPQSAEAENWLTYLLDIELRFDDLIAHQMRMQSLVPTDGRRIMLALMLPQFYRSIEEMQCARGRVAREVQNLLDGPPLRIADPAREIGVTMFGLAYHGENDRELLQQVTRLCRKAYQPRYRGQPGNRRRGKIRIGFFSEHFNSHSIGRLTKGLITHLSRRDFEVYVFSFARHRDTVAEQIRAGADHYLAFADETLADIEAVIARQELDVLIYPDIGMDPLPYFLAYSRLAPLQCVTWGHPVTTGIDTIDCFISADAIELPDSAAHYSEQLVRLPAFVLPAYERPPPLPSAKSREHFGLRDDRHLYVCPQSLVKLHPDFDSVFGEILLRDPVGEVLLIHHEYPQYATLLRERFRRKFPDAVDRVRFMPRMQWADCLNLMAISDVMLDTFHFGGGNTSCEALAMATPVVTLPHAYLRGRFTAACYWQMEMDDCVARTPRDYVDIALRLAQERDYREHITESIAARRDAIFDNLKSVRAFEEFFLASVPRS